MNRDISMESERKLSAKDISSLMSEMGATAAKAGQIIKQATSKQKDDALKIAAQQIKNNKDMILGIIWIINLLNQKLLILRKQKIFSKHVLLSIILKNTIGTTP